MKETYDVTDKRCHFIMQDGSQCGGFHQKNSLFCFRHDPERAEERLLASREGGLARRPEWHLKSLPLEDPKDVAKLVGETINELREGKVDPRIATAVFYGANSLIKAFEMANLSERLLEIEKLLIMKPNQPWDFKDVSSG